MRLPSVPPRPRVAPSAVADPPTGFRRRFAMRPGMISCTDDFTRSQISSDIAWGSCRCRWIRLWPSLSEELHWYKVMNPGWTLTTLLAENTVLLHIVSVNKIRLTQVRLRLTISRPFGSRPPRSFAVQMQDGVAHHWR